MKNLLIIISQADNKEEAIEEAESMWDITAVNGIVIHPGENGAYQVAHAPKGVTADVSEV